MKIRESHSPTSGLPSNPSSDSMQEWKIKQSYEHKKWRSTIQEWLSQIAVCFSVNGEDQGIAFSNIRLPVKPIVGFYAGMENKTTLAHYEHKKNIGKAI